MGINEYIQIGSRIKSLRMQKGYTQADMAKLLNIPRSSYANYENNRREPSMQIIQKIANIFDISISALLAEPSSFTDIQILLAETNIENLPIPSFNGIDKTKFNQLISYFAKLSPLGKKKLVEYAKDLTLIPDYTTFSKRDLKVNAAHSKSSTTE